MEMAKVDNQEMTDKIYDLMIKKDTSKLNQREKLEYCASLCKSLGLNPLTQPFEFIRLNGKETPYAKKDATDQLRKVYNVSLEVTSEGGTPGIYMVRAKATLPNNRTDMATGVVNVANLKGDALCNAIMKAETKAKRRVTLSICGLGFLDEAEFDTIAQTKGIALADQKPKPSIEDRKTPLLETISGLLSQLTNNYGNAAKLKAIYAELNVKNKKELMAIPYEEMFEVVSLLESMQDDEDEQSKEQLENEKLEF